MPKLENALASEAVRQYYERLFENSLDVHVIRPTIRVEEPDDLYVRRNLLPVEIHIYRKATTSQQLSDAADDLIRKFDEWLEKQVD